MCMYDEVKNSFIIKSFSVCLNWVSPKTQLQVYTLKHTIS